jgi:SAM-dependent methyltransferase
MSARPLDEVQAFFAARAATWDARFPDDGPAYDRAAAELAPPPGGTVLDLGAGTGRALGRLRQHVGEAGLIVAIDVTWQMLTVVGDAGRDRDAALVLADAVRLPLADSSCDAVFAAGIIHHLPGPDHGLIELRRVTRPSARLAIFHPIGRAALAARHGRTLSDQDLLNGRNLGPQLERHGWTLSSLDDSDERYLALATRI